MRSFVGRTSERLSICKARCHENETDEETRAHDGFWARANM